MPELPEVQTTVNGLNNEVAGLSIKNVWTSYNSVFHAGKDNIKNPKYFLFFKKNVIGTKIQRAERVGKNILIQLSTGYTILAHMKMTGHFMYGKYKKSGQSWVPEDVKSPLSDPFNRHIRLIFELSNGRHLAFSDTRKFAKVFIFESKNKKDIPDISLIGPDPLSKDFTVGKLMSQIAKHPRWKIKQALLDQEIIAGIGNIYSDEMLWGAGIHPLSLVSKIPKEKMISLHKAMKKVLKKGLDFGGDSMSDYRNIHGLPGKFQHKHNVYRKAGEKCPKNDGGIIQRILVGSRNGHFCPVHQKLYT